MRFEKPTFKEFNSLITKEKKVVCFGVSKHIRSFNDRNGSAEWLSNVDYFVDNDETMWDRTVEICNKNFLIYSPKRLSKIRNAIIIITVGNAGSFNSIVKQLYEMNIDDTVKCISLLRIEGLETYDNSIMDVYLDKRNVLVNKTIHSFWFSKDPKTKKYIECIDSWKRFCPDYEIIEWNADNYDIEKNKYTKKAYDLKQWAFVSDFARLDVVYQHGGIYLDMDVELLKTLDDLLYLDAFFSIDSYGKVDLGTGFGASKGNKIIKKLLQVYDNLDFIMEEEWKGLPGWKGLVPQPTRLLPVFKEIGFEERGDTQYVNHCMFLSPDYFRVIEDTSHKYRKFGGKEYAIHWHNGGWKSKEWLDERDRINKNKRDQFDFYDSFVK